MNDISSTVKTATELATSVSGLASAAGASQLGRRMLAALGDAAGARWSDAENLRAMKRQYKALQKAVEFVEGIGGDVRTIPVKILAPWLEGVALEEDESLQTMWAALLATSSRPGKTEAVTPRFIDMLKRLSSHEARTLQVVFENGSASSKRISVDSIIAKLDDPRIQIDETVLILEGLESERLVVSDEGVGYKGHKLTTLGRAFVQACQPPKLASL